MHHPNGGDRLGISEPSTVCDVSVVFLSFTSEGAMKGARDFPWHFPIE